MNKESPEKLIDNHHIYGEGEKIIADVSAESGILDAGSGGEQIKQTLFPLLKERISDDSCQEYGKGNIDFQGAPFEEVQHIFVGLACRRAGSGVGRARNSQVFGRHPKIQKEDRKKHRGHRAENQISIG